MPRVRRLARRQSRPDRGRRTNLSPQLSSFIGREQELAEVGRLLDSTRLLCLTGPGGIGKTRLAVEVANAVAANYVDGVWLVELAPVADGDLVARSVARALGVVERVNEPLLTTLADFIGDKQLLLVLDNCEHLLEASARAAERLLRSCPGLRIIATSREPLGIGGETVWRVPSLSVPESRDTTTLEALPQADAVRLFIERACALAPGFTITEHNAHAIAQVCQRLEGIPLALELAAARVPVLSVELIAERVDDALRLLVTGSRVAPPRQQTLRATLDWSHGLLSEAEQHLFARLSVFAGGFTLEAAETICAGYGIQPGEVLDLLAHLVNKSLVLGETRTDGSLRYRLLEPVRQFGAELLSKSGETARLRDCHVDWFVGQASQAADGIWGPQQADWFVWFDQELDNLRAALDWAIDSDNAGVGLRLGASLQYFWLQGGHMAEGRSRLLALLALPSAASNPSAEAEALVAIGHLCTRFAGELGAARSYAERGLTLARQIADRLGLRFEAARCLGWATWRAPTSCFRNLLRPPGKSAQRQSREHWRRSRGRASSRATWRPGAP
jgi:non-specific serine/threonine protein kinase